MAMQLLFFKWQAVFWKQDYFLQSAWAAGQFRSDFENEATSSQHRLDLYCTHSVVGMKFFFEGTLPFNSLE